MPWKNSGEVKWTDEQLEQIEMEYSTLGPRKLSEKMNVPIVCLKNKANAMGVRFFTPQQWTKEQLQILRERYGIDGPTKLSEEMGIPYWTLMSKARRMGIKPKNGPQIRDFVWTEERLQAIRDRYVEESAYKLAKEFGLPIGRIRSKAVELGLRTIAGHATAGSIRTW
jgi:hypothetical protein